MNRIWSRTYLALWALWAGFAVYLGLVGGHVNRKYWWALVGSFFVLEGIGAIKRSDKMPMLTEVFGRYVPPWVLFPVLAIALWRLSHWVPDVAIWAFGAWENVHFIQTYHTYQRLGRESP